MSNLLKILALGVGALGFAAWSSYVSGTARAQNDPGPVPAEPIPLVNSSRDILGGTIRYADGAVAKLESMIVTIKSGERTPWHSHPVPTFGYLLEGQITVHYETGEVRTIREGEALIEAQFTPHRGVNTSGKPARILVVYAGVPGLENTASETPGSN